MKGRLTPLPGPVEDLPVAEVAAAAEGDGARADAAEREGDLPEGRALEDPLGPEPEELVRWRKTDGPALDRERSPRAA